MQGLGRGSVCDKRDVVSDAKRNSTVDTQEHGMTAKANLCPDAGHSGLAVSFCD